MRTSLLIRLASPARRCGPEEGGDREQRASGSLLAAGLGAGYADRVPPDSAYWALVEVIDGLTSVTSASLRGASPHRSGSGPDDRCADRCAGWRRTVTASGRWERARRHAATASKRPAGTSCCASTHRRCWRAAYQGRGRWARRPIREVLPSAAAQPWWALGRRRPRGATARPQRAGRPTVQLPGEPPLGLVIAGSDDKAAVRGFGAHTGPRAFGRWAWWSDCLGRPGLRTVLQLPDERSRRRRRRVVRAVSQNRWSGGTLPGIVRQ